MDILKNCQRKLREGVSWQTPQEEDQSLTLPRNKKCEQEHSHDPFQLQETCMEAVQGPSLGTGNTNKGSDWAPSTDTANMKKSSPGDLPQNESHKEEWPW